MKYSFKPLSRVKDFHIISYYKHLVIKGHPDALSSLWVLRHKTLQCDIRSSLKIYNCSDWYSVVKTYCFNVPHYTACRKVTSASATWYPPGSTKIVRNSRWDSKMANEGTGGGEGVVKFTAIYIYIQGVSVNYCHFQLNSALAITNLFIWKQCQSNKQGLEFHIWVALWMTCSIWALWGSRTAWRRNTKFCTTRVSIPLVTCAQLSLILSFSSGRVRGALLNALSFR